MGIFNQFRDTIFLKEESSLMNELNTLREIRNNIIDTKDIDKDIKLIEYGLQGEKEIAFELKHANIGMYVLHDINITYEDLKAQIDYIIITKGYCYLVECKNLYGNIKVNSRGEFQRTLYVNGKEIKEAIYSPYTQACRHLEVLKKRWLSKTRKINLLFGGEKEFDNYWYKPLVVLTNSKSMIDIQYAPREIKQHTVRVDNLIKYIKDDINNYDSNRYNSKKLMESLAGKFLEAHISENTSFATKYLKNQEEEKSSPTENELHDKLIEYRRNKANKMNVPAFYIYTNDELESLIKLKPKTLDELKQANILSPIKIKCHGEEIISLIND